MSNLPEYVFDQENGPVMTFYSASMSASVYMTNTGQFGFGNTGSASVDTSITAMTSSYIGSSNVDVLDLSNGVGVGGLLICNHFMAPTTATIMDFAVASSGTSAGITISGSEIGRPGILQFSTGTTATGRTTLYTSITSIQFGGTNTYIVEGAIHLPTLSTTSNRYSIYFGFGDTTGAGDMVDGAYFMYNDTNSPNWQYKTAANSVRTTNTSTVPAEVTSWHRLKIKVVGNTSATFYIDDVQVGDPITTNIPTGYARTTGVIFKIEKSVGSTTSIFRADYCKLLLK